MWGHIRLKKCCIQVCQVHDKVIFVVYRDGVGGSMKKIVTVLAGAILTLGLAGCGASEEGVRWFVCEGFPSHQGDEPE